MSSRERRLLDKDKEIRKLKSTAGHYFNCTIDGAIKIYKLKKALGIAVDALTTIRRYTAINQFTPKSREAHFVAKRVLQQINKKEEK